jgi:hypothetical protein
MSPTVGTFDMLAEANWVIVPESKMLHAPLEHYPWATEPWVESGETVCGIAGRLDIPGIISRSSLERCPKCCHAFVLPQGFGSPKNDPACRLLLTTIVE